MTASFSLQYTLAVSLQPNVTTGTRMPAPLYALPTLSQQPPSLFRIFSTRMTTPSDPRYLPPGSNLLPSAVQPQLSVRGTGVPAYLRLLSLPAHSSNTTTGIFLPLFFHRGPFLFGDSGTGMPTSSNPQHHCQYLCSSCQQSNLKDLTTT